MFGSFPKLYRMGLRQVRDIFEDVVEVTEKLDGSQFAFGRVDDQLKMRSKGREVFEGLGDKLFTPVIDHVVQIQHLLPVNTVFYGETLAKPKHNILKYDRVPRNNFALFGVYFMDLEVYAGNYRELEFWADDLEIDVVPLLHTGKLDPGDVHTFLEKDSYLGGCKIEGVVIKNYTRSVLIDHGRIEIPIMGAKYVSEKFKEVMGQKSAPRSGKLEELADHYRTEARWRKAIVHRSEDGKLSRDFSDIGPLIKEIQRDIKDEEQETIKDRLWAMFHKQILSRSIAGFPEKYKEWLLNDDV